MQPQTVHLLSEKIQDTCIKPFSSQKKQNQDISKNTQGNSIMDYETGGSYKIIKNNILNIENLKNF